MPVLCGVRLAYEARVQLRWSAGERQSKLQGMQQVRAFRAEVLQRGEAQVGTHGPPSLPSSRRVFMCKKGDGKGRGVT